MSLGEQITSIMPQAMSEMPKSGLTLAVVTNIKDPESLGRIKCRPVTNDNDIAETDWCFCMTPAGGKGYGLFFFPNVGDLVILLYLNGNVHHPIALGAYWADEVKAPYAINDGKNEVISIKTPTGSEIKFDDVSEKQKITVKTPSGAEILIDDDARVLSVKGNGDNSLTIKWEAGEIELKAKTKLTLSAGDTSVVLESSGSIEGKASQKINLEAGNIGIKGKMNIKAESPAVSLNSSGTLDLTASGATTVKGSAVQIN